MRHGAVLSAVRKGFWHDRAYFRHLERCASSFAKEFGESRPHLSKNIPEKVIAPYCFFCGGVGVHHLSENNLIVERGASEQYNAMIGCLITGSGLPADVKDHHTSTRGKPLLDERTFQQLLAAAYLLQQHYDRLLPRALKATYAQTLSDGAIVEKVRPPQVLPTPQTRAHPVQPLVPVRLAHPACRNKALGKQFSLTDILF